MIAACKKKQPVIPEALTNYIVGVYVATRRELGQEQQGGHQSDLATPQQRHSQLCSEFQQPCYIGPAEDAWLMWFKQEDVNEAMRLMEMSKQSLFDDEQASRSVRPINAIYSIIREMADPDTVQFVEARQHILAKGYTPNQFEECLDEYERLNIFQINQSRTRITFRVI